MIVGMVWYVNCVSLKYINTKYEQVLNNDLRVVVVVYPFPWPLLVGEFIMVTLFYII